MAAEFSLPNDKSELARGKPNVTDELSALNNHGDKDKNDLPSTVDPLQHLTIQLIPRCLKIHLVSDNELDYILSTAIGTSISFSLFTIFLGTCISCWNTFYATKLDATKHSVYTLLTLISGILTFCFLIGAIFGFRKLKRKICEIKQGKGAHDR